MTALTPVVRTSWEAAARLRTYKTGLNRWASPYVLRKLDLYELHHFASARTSNDDTDDSASYDPSIASMRKLYVSAVNVHQATGTTAIVFALGIIGRTQSLMERMIATEYRSYGSVTFEANGEKIGFMIAQSSLPLWPSQGRLDVFASGPKAIEVLLPLAMIVVL